MFTCQNINTKSRREERDGQCVDALARRMRDGIAGGSFAKIENSQR